MKRQRETKSTVTPPPLHIGQEEINNNPLHLDIRWFLQQETRSWAIMISSTPPTSTKRSAPPASLQRECEVPPVCDNVHIHTKEIGEMLTIWLGCPLRCVGTRSLALLCAARRRISSSTVPRTTHTHPCSRPWSPLSLVSEVL